MSYRSYSKNLEKKFFDLYHLIFDLFHFYRPQRSCGKVIFSQASVSHSVNRGKGCLADTPLGRHPTQCMPGYTAPCPVHAGIHTPRQTTPNACWDTHPPMHAGIHPPPVATAADGMHPTAMHSCCFCIRSI